MRAPYEIIQDVLNEKDEPDDAIIDLSDYILNSSEPLKYECIRRALFSLKYNKEIDFCGHLRQSMQVLKCSFNITSKYYKIIKENKNLFGFYLTSIQDNQYTVSIEIKILENIDDLRSIYNNAKIKNVKKSFGDGKLYKYFGYTEYSSLAQKILIYTIVNMRENETLLACLPTGGGKSLSWQLPGISNLYQGLIIVVVPTVALAIDHEINTKKIYERNKNVNTFSAAYYSGLHPSQKQKIFIGVEEGSLSMLYISPEALLHSEFKDRIFKAAEKGLVSALVIDEAHLVVSWGIKFRPEFQLLASFRNNIRKLSPEGIKTLLLSATFTEEDVEIIKTIFADKIMSEFRADELRIEPEFYLHKCRDEDERKDLILRLVAQAPKPMIIYTSKPEFAKVYYDLIISRGFKNIEVFTGETHNEKREDILDSWKNDKTDIIVATSAFGMGVDKPDIRTIISAYIPENVSRYYQEIGRAGRDGYSSLCYWLINEAIDNDINKNLSKATVLRVDSILDRWSSLISHVSRRESPNRVWLDVKSPPEHLMYEITGQKNAGWNKDVILFLLRCGLIEILDIEITSAQKYQVLVELKNIEILENRDKLFKYIEPFREKERTRINLGLESVKKLIKSDKKNCFSKVFVEEFPLSKNLCSGCPYCRRKNFQPNYTDSEICIRSNKIYLKEEFNPIGNDYFQNMIKIYREILINSSKYIDQSDYIDCISLLVRNHINIIITPEKLLGKELLDTLATYEIEGYLLLTLDEVLNVQIDWLNGVCAIIYDSDSKVTNNLFAFSRKYLSADPQNRVIHITMHNHYVETEKRMLREIADLDISYNSIINGGI